MKRLILTLLCLLLLSLGSVASAEDYIMSPGDKLMITVTGYDEYSSKSGAMDTAYVVRPDGKLSFPLIGTIDTTGKTVQDFTSELAYKLSEYLVDPDVSVNIIQLGTTRVFVLGEVNKPGMYELTKSHRMLDAIGAANGFTKDAAKKRVYLVHYGDTKTEQATKLNLNDYLTKSDSSQNVVLKEGDCLYLTSNGRFSFNTDLLPWISAWYMFDRIHNDK